MAIGCKTIIPQISGGLILLWQTTFWFEQKVRHPMLKSDRSFHNLVFDSAVLRFVPGPIYADIFRPYTKSKTG